MARVSFGDLLDIYRSAQWDSEPPGATVTVASEGILRTLRLIDSDEEAADDSGITVETDPAELAVGLTTRLKLKAPKQALGFLARDLDDLLRNPLARTREPEAYFIISDRYAKGGATPPPLLSVYRTALSLVQLFAEAASYLDITRTELVFVQERRVVIPVDYRSETLSQLDLDATRRLLDYFKDETHREQKLEILALSIVQIAETQPAKDRFTFLARNIGLCADAVRDGYKLFASSFSYTKIRSELESARIDFASKIHKTVVDIQGQILGLPIATIVVASQLKVADSCGLELWTDVAVVSGAWIFAVLLMISIANQWLTLNVIGTEIERQKRRLTRDYESLGSQFTGVFDSLNGRVVWHRIGLAAVAIIGLVGALFATVAFDQVTRIDALDCLTGRLPFQAASLVSGLTASASVA